MHEASITEALVDQVREHVPAGARLVSVSIEVGELEHLDGEVMRTIFTAATEGTALAGATLEIERVALKVRCRGCGTTHEPEDAAMLMCPECGRVLPDVIEGSGMLLRSLEVDEPEGEVER